MDSPSESALPKKGSNSGCKNQSQDDFIMATNNSSIVSKRSVERLYFPNEAHFFRYFVKKPQRRAPLINRGYWLRMKAIDQAVRRFLERPSPKKKVVINLGCGYDPLPWQCLTRYPDACRGVSFVDIDYRDLMLKKRAVVRDVHQLNSILTGTEEAEGDVLLKSDCYFQVGCDLRDLRRLSDIISSIVDIQVCQILFTAEVSITYMSAESSDALIKFCGTLPDACFCLLEQLLPDGPDHPFSQTMIAHFNKLQTPLHAVKKYPTELAQSRRFVDLGWKDVTVHNLWEIWGSSDFVTSQERRDLDLIEPFDEWEEFALFSSHYFLLQGSTAGKPLNHGDGSPQEAVSQLGAVPPTSSNFQITFSANPESKGYRRFAAIMPTRSQDRAHDRIAVFGGMGLASRVNSYDEYHFTDQLNHIPYYSESPLIAPSSRMCHTITDLGDTGALLVGGRTSPDSGLVDCWLYHKWLNVWERVDDLPWPLYRHQAIKIDQHHVLVSTGRMNSCSISDQFLIWSRRGWFKCLYGSDSLIPVKAHGSVLINHPFAFTHTADIRNEIQHLGMLAGGISNDGIILNQTLRWSLTNVSSAEPCISFQAAKTIALFSRFGASIVNHHNKIFLIGGIVRNKLLHQADEICCFEVRENLLVLVPALLKLSPTIPRPVLIGASAFSTEQSLVIVGGSAVCFSFGTYWNQGVYVISSNNSKVVVENASALSPLAGVQQKPTWEFSRTVCTEDVNLGAKYLNPPTTAQDRVTLSVPRVRFGSNIDFNQLLCASKPIIFENFDIGNCTSLWTPAYLKQRVGIDREVIVHEATTEHMDFTTKNFTYTSKHFGDFIDEIETGGRLYLRSLSLEQPSLSPAIFVRDFPSIAADFRVPPELSLISEIAHSSPLRISGPVILWLHYDVMANILCQIRGTKRLLLYAPSDFKYFGFEPGASSSSTNVFDGASPAGSQPYEALLEAGDILFIPSLWLHSASPTSTVSIAVNIFFRNLKSGYATGKDVYGNRDLQVYEKGRQDVAKILRSFDGVPAEARSFYLERLSEELKRKAS